MVSHNAKRDSEKGKGDERSEGNTNIEDEDSNNSDHPFFETFGYLWSFFYFLGGCFRITTAFLSPSGPPLCPFPSLLPFPPPFFFIHNGLF
jgi:hypothetical protein